MKKIKDASPEPAKEDPSQSIADQLEERLINFAVPHHKTGGEVAENTRWSSRCRPDPAMWNFAGSKLWRS